MLSVVAVLKLTCARIGYVYLAPVTPPQWDRLLFRLLGHSWSALSEMQDERATGDCDSDVNSP